MHYSKFQISYKNMSLLINIYFNGILRFTKIFIQKVSFSYQNISKDSKSVICLNYMLYVFAVY